MLSASFEANFLKAVQLLHSPDKGATDQLKSMLDECLAQKKAPLAATVPMKPSTNIKPVTAPRPQPPPPVTVPQPAHPVQIDVDLGLADCGCVVCKRLDQSVGNEIVECQECHSLFHQECHKPSLANENVKDPRFIWYCSTCTSKRKKVKLPAKPPTSSSANSSANKDTKDQQNPEVSPFKSWSFLKK